MPIPSQQAATQEPEVSHRGLVDPALPVLAGHFPGNPLVPAALQLEWMLAALPGGSTEEARWNIRQAKFLKPLRPGMAYAIDVRAQERAYRVNLTGPDGLHSTATIERLPA